MIDDLLTNVWQRHREAALPDVGAAPKCGTAGGWHGADHCSIDWDGKIEKIFMYIAFTHTFLGNFIFYLLFNID